MADGRHGERSLWELSADEKRLLLITFAGSLASIIAGAAMIGLAIAFAKAEDRHPLSPWLLPVITAVVIGLAVVYYVWRPAEDLPPLARRVFDVGTVIMPALMILWLVGVAAGIH